MVRAGMRLFTVKEASRSFCLLIAFLSRPWLWIHLHLKSFIKQNQAINLWQLLELYSTWLFISPFLNLASQKHLKSNLMF